MEISQPTLQEIVYNTGKIIDVRARLNGLFNREGLAINELARMSALSQYQLAIDALHEEQKVSQLPFIIIGCGGSIISKKNPRLGVFDPTDFSRTYDRVWDLIMTRSQTRFSLPSDLDVIVDNPQATVLDTLAKKIYRTTGVFVDFQTDLHTENPHHPPMMHIKDLTHNGLLKLYGH